MSLGQSARGVRMRGATSHAPSEHWPAYHPALADVLAGCAESGQRVYLFGADATTLYGLRDRIAVAFPDLHLAGMCDAAFTGPISRDILLHMASCGPDLIVADVPDGLFRRLQADASELVPGARVVNLPYGFAPAGSFRCVFSQLADKLPDAPRRALAIAWRGLSVHLRFGVIVIRQKLGLAIR